MINIGCSILVTYHGVDGGKACPRKPIYPFTNYKKELPAKKIAYVGVDCHTNSLTIAVMEPGGLMK